MMITKKAQINMIFTFIAALLVIGVIVLVATKTLGGTLKDKCTADIVVFSDKLKEAIRTNNDYGGINEQTFLAPCDYKTICLVDAKVLSDSVFNGNFKNTVNEMNDFPGKTFILDSVVMTGSINNTVDTNIFLIDGKGFVLDVGFAPQIELEDQVNITCIDARQGKFTFLFRGQGRTTLISEP